MIVCGGCLIERKDIKFFSCNIWICHKCKRLLWMTGKKYKLLIVWLYELMGYYWQ